MPLPREQQSGSDSNDDVKNKVLKGDFSGFVAVFFFDFVSPL
jgi:hypothetical protein